MVNKGFRHGHRDRGGHRAAGELRFRSGHRGRGPPVSPTGSAPRSIRPTEITDRWTTQEKSGTYLTHPASGTVELIRSCAIHVSLCESTRSCAALAAMHGFQTDVDVDVFILPAIPGKRGVVSPAGGHLPGPGNRPGRSQHPGLHHHPRNGSCADLGLPGRPTGSLERLPGYPGSGRIAP